MASLPDRKMTDNGTVEVPLLSLSQGQRGRIARLEGGRRFQANLRARGVREGKALVVISVQPWGGPVIIDVEGEQVALGRGMAHNIVVEIEAGERVAPAADARAGSAGRWRGRGRHKARWILRLMRGRGRTGRGRARRV